MNQRIQELLKMVRKQARLKQTDLAEKMSVKGSTISNWENGISEPDMDSFVEYCRLCGADYLAMMNLAYGDPSQGVYPMECTAEEMEMIRKFRLLDKRGKRVVTRNLNAEYDETQRNG